MYTKRSTEDVERINNEHRDMIMSAGILARRLMKINQKEEWTAVVTWLRTAAAQIQNASKPGDYYSMGAKDPGDVPSNLRSAQRRRR